MRGDSRTFLISGEEFVVKKLPAQVHMESLARSVDLMKPERPKNPDLVDEYEDYRTDYRTDMDFLIDLAVYTLNASRSNDQVRRFEVTRKWLLDHVSSDRLEELIYAVLDPFLTRRDERNAAMEKKKAETMTTYLEPAIREIVRNEMNSQRKNR